MVNFVYPPYCYYDSVKCPCIVRVTASLKSATLIIIIIIIILRDGDGFVSGPYPKNDVFIFWMGLSQSVYLPS